MPVSDELRLQPLTAIGEFTVIRLRLNRAPLIAHRRKKLRQLEREQLMTRYETLLQSLSSLAGQQVALLTEQQRRLQEQRTLLALLVRQKEKE